MIAFETIKQEDLQLLKSWIGNDPWHTNKEAVEWWTKGYISFKLVDELGPTVFIRFDREDDRVRLHSQFAPSQEVSEKRVAISIVDAIPRFIEKAKVDGVKAIVTESVSPKLVAFLTSRVGFDYAGHGNDYVLSFQEN